MDATQVIGKILIVDDEDIFRGALKSTLAQAGFEITEAPNVKLAQQLVGFDKFDLVITDINMPGGSGIELVHFMRRSGITTPIILMTGFAELKELHEAGEIGANGFLPKPFKREELFSLLKSCLQPVESAAKVNCDADFCKLSINDFVSGKEIQYDIYIRLSESKYIKIAHQGEDLSVERIRSYRSKNISFLYMLKEDFRKYIGFAISLSQALKGSSKVAKEKKLNFLKHTSELILEQIHSNEVDAAQFDDAKTVVDTAVSMLSDDKDAFDLLNVLNSHTDYLYAHSLGVSLYSAMIAREMRWNSPANIFKVSMGGLFHDIGKKEIAREMLMKSRKDLSAEEIKTIESHAQRGMEILGQIQSIPSDILQIAFQHHENCAGLGYPKGLKHNHIHPMARVVSVANEFCNLILKSPKSPGLGPKEAIERMLQVNPEAFDPAPFSALLRIFKITPSAEFIRQHKGWKTSL